MVLFIVFERQHLDRVHVDDTHVVLSFFEHAVEVLEREHVDVAANKVVPVVVNRLLSDGYRTAFSNGQPILACTLAREFLTPHARRCGSGRRHALRDE